MRAAQIVDGKVVNIIMVGSLDAMPDMQLVEAGNAEVDDHWDGSDFIKHQPAAPTVPKRVTMRQARLALMKIGKLAQVDAAIATLSADKRAVAEIEWEFSSEVFRERELVVLIGAALQLDGAALDALFIDAATL